ncbi:VOC family protein [Nocardia callitridis]|uniref:VOC family protein n=1 Tax=Nocardia callitridis TaxID=648753 RepID=A0ABP9JRH5_9NOCA
MTESTQSTATNTTTKSAVWPCLSFRDARANAEFLVQAFGFEISALYARNDDPSIVEHGELRWPLGGGVMFGSALPDGGPFKGRAPGQDSVYLVCDNPDGLFERAQAAGAEVVRGLRDEDYGSRGFSARDPEGNVWSFGTYWGS